MTREELIRAHFDRTMGLIEIGPSYNPIVPKADGWRTIIIDHASRDDLLRKYSTMGVRTTDRIEAVDYVWKDGPLTALIPPNMHGEFDGLIASHVGEHFPDFIGFLKGASALLKPTGIMALALPDKRTCFDFFQPLTMTGDVVDAHAQQRVRHQRRTLFNHTAYRTTRNAESGWPSAENSSPFRLAHSIYEAQQVYNDASEDPSSPYTDTHAWTFTPKSFELLMLELNLLGHTDWAIRTIQSAGSIEFFAWLERKRLVMSEVDAQAARLSLLTELVYESRCTITQLDTAEAMSETGIEASISWPRPRPCIAAIIPLYNGARYIEETLNSVFQQTSPPTEVIVIDDGSTDNGLGQAIVERMARNHPIRLIRKPNGGQSSARNLGVRESSSELLAFLDQDDVWYESHLEELVRPFQRRSVPPIGWVYSNLDEINQEGDLTRRSFLSSLSTKHPKNLIEECIGEDMFVLPSAAMINREAFERVGGFDERLSGYEDDDLFLRILRAGYDNLYLDRPLSKWRIYSGSASYTANMTRSRAIYTRKLLEMFPDDILRARYYTRDLIVPRFTQHAIREYQNAVKLSTPEAISDALSEIRFLSQYDKSVTINLFFSMLAHYRDALIEGSNAAIDAAWVAMAETAAEVPNRRLLTNIAIKILRNARVARGAFALRRLARPVIRNVFSA
jgi:glycosyltransferase involved in cell wall biosynthesis